MKVLILCEFSGVVRDAFLDRGHDAVSVDLLPCESPKNGPIGECGYRHWEMDCMKYVKQCSAELNTYDLIIAHPPCTTVAVSGNSTYGKSKPKHGERVGYCKWVDELWARCMTISPRLVFENPVGVLPSMTCLPKPYYIQPYEFGHMEQKKTGLFSHGLPRLQPTNNVYDEMMKLPKSKRERVFYESPGRDRWKKRSITYKGVAKAMAEQWGNLT